MQGSLVENYHFQKIQKNKNNFLHIKDILQA